jgi:hypothetical protein
MLLDKAIMQQISRLDRFPDLCKQFRGRFLVNRNDGCNITDERNARHSGQWRSARRLAAVTSDWSVSSRSRFMARPP